MKKYLLILLMFTPFVNIYAGDGSKANPFSPTDIINKVNSANGNYCTCDYWVKAYIGIYTGYTTIFEYGGTRTVEYKYLLLSEEPGIQYSSRNQSRYNARQLVMVAGGDDWLQNHSDITNAFDTNADTTILVHVTAFYRSGGQGFNAVLIDSYELSEDTSGILRVSSNSNNTQKLIVFNLKGEQINNLEKGINIIQMPNGSSKKVFVK